MASRVICLKLFKIDSGRRYSRMRAAAFFRRHTLRGRRLRDGGSEVYPVPYSIFSRPD